MVVHDECEGHHVPEVVEHIVDEHSVQNIIYDNRLNHVEDCSRDVHENEDQEDRPYSCCFGHHHFSVKVAVDLDK